jgi:hypothetical protein
MQVVYIYSHWRICALPLLLQYLGHEIVEKLLGKCQKVPQESRNLPDLVSTKHLYFQLLLLSAILPKPPRLFMSLPTQAKSLCDGGTAIPSASVSHAFAALLLHANHMIVHVYNGVSLH